MKKINYSQIAKQAGYSRQYLCNILAGRNVPMYKAAKAFAAATNTDIFLWLEGSVDEIRAAIGCDEP